MYKYNNLQIGSSFVPEVEQDQAMRLKMLEFYKDLGLNQVRFAIRWNVVEAAGSFEESYYMELLDQCVDDFEVVLNVGPYKTAAWPEVHSPDYIDVTEKTIDAECQECKIGLKYLKKLLTSIKKRYGDKINIFQPENESYNPFGDKRTTFNTAYIRKVISTIKDFYPSCTILLNSNGVYDYRKIIRTIDDLDGNFVVGTDLYYDSISIPKFFVKKIDNLWKVPFVHKSYSSLNNYLLKKGWSHQITEAQFEPWGPRKRPGNNYEDFLFLLDRCMEGLETNKTGFNQVNLWGAWHLSRFFINNNATKDHQKIYNLIKTINKN